MPAHECLECGSVLFEKIKNSTQSSTNAICDLCGLPAHIPGFVETTSAIDEIKKEKI